MNAIQWDIDSATKLVKSAAGLSIIWAGATFGPVADLTEICHGSLLSECRNAMETAGRLVEVHSCDVGPAGETETVIIG
jgi:hypothetical protein